MYEAISNQETGTDSQRPTTTRHVIYKACEYPNSQPIQTLQSEITSSMLLQQLMYYNVYYSIIQVYLYLASQVYRWLYLNLSADREYNVPVRFILLAIFIPLEYFRLLNGFSGNLRETFPEVLAFFLLTIFSIANQIICMTIVNPTPLEFSLLLYGVIMHAMQLIVCIYSLRKLTQAQTALFFWRSPSSSKVKINYKRRFN